MWYLIVTARSLIWILLSLVATLLMLSALLSPTWIVAPLEVIKTDNETLSYHPSVGVYAKCSKIMKYTYPVCTFLTVEGLATESRVFPNEWKAAVIFIALGITIMSLTVCMGLIGCCVQSIFKKSIYNISGAAQAISGICYILGVMLHPMAWGSTRVQKLCGREAAPFYLDNCSLGLGLWMAIVGTILTFICACLSVPAERSTSSDKVQDKIYEGQTLICLT